jgi:hypothetical protein
MYGVQENGHVMMKMRHKLVIEDFGIPLRARVQLGTLEKHYFVIPIKCIQETNRK